MRSFEGMTVLLSGATGGFGTQLARRLAADGAKLVLSDLEVEPLQALAASLKSGVATFAGDICDESVSERLVSTTQELFGWLDIAINNAGDVKTYGSL